MAFAGWASDPSVIHEGTPNLRSEPAGHPIPYWDKNRVWYVAQVLWCIWSLRSAQRSFLLAPCKDYRVNRSLPKWGFRSSPNKPSLNYPSKTYHPFLDPPRWRGKPILQRVARFVPNKIHNETKTNERAKQSTTRPPSPYFSRLCFHL